MTDTAAPRDTYRHGDLRQALLSAGVEMAQEGGPDSVVLREATRRVGVSPNAAYRHFADRQALLVAVSATAQGFVADSMEGRRQAVPSTDDAVVDARARLRAVGEGYVGYARQQPGLFRAAFTVPDNLANSGAAAKAGALGFTPFQVLGIALDELEVVGVIPSERRANAELIAWSAVHGLGMLVIDGPLRGLTDPVIDHMTARLIDMVDRGL